jgi:hypothetical protein
MHEIGKESPDNGILNTVAQGSQKMLAEVAQLGNQSLLSAKALTNAAAQLAIPAFQIVPKERPVPDRVEKPDDGLMGPRKNNEEEPPKRNDVGDVALFVASPVLGAGRWIYRKLTK